MFLIFATVKYLKRERVRKKSIERKRKKSLKREQKFFYKVKWY